MISEYILDIKILLEICSLQTKSYKKNIQGPIRCIPVLSGSVSWKLLFIASRDV
jgi:hypothetical protein